jgi:hypothetical protein
MAFTREGEAEADLLGAERGHPVGDRVSHFRHPVASDRNGDAAITPATGPATGVARSLRDPCGYPRVRDGSGGWAQIQTRS